MPRTAAPRNWRLEIVAWLAAIALVAAALIFSRGSDDPAPTQAPPDRPPAETPAVTP